jgi:hypothetical protein
MRRLGPRKTTLAALSLVGAAFLSLAFFLVWPHQAPWRMVLQITGTRPADTNVLLVSVTLSNGTSRQLNVVEGDNGDAAFYLDVGLQYGLQLGRGLVNQGKLNLAPGATLTDTVRITNPPPRFRLKVPIRDFAAEPRRSTGYRIVLGYVAQKLMDWHLLRSSLQPPVSSAWVETKMPVAEIWGEIAQLQRLREQALRSEPPMAATILSNVCGTAGAGARGDPYLVQVYANERMILIQDTIKHLRKRTGENLGPDPQPWISKYAPK